MFDCSFHRNWNQTKVVRKGKFSWQACSGSMWHEVSHSTALVWIVKKNHQSSRWYLSTSCFVQTTIQTQIYSLLNYNGRRSETYEYLLLLVRRLKQWICYQNICWYIFYHLTNRLISSDVPVEFEPFQNLLWNNIVLTTLNNCN